MQFALLIYQDIERIVEGGSESELAEITDVLEEYIALQSTPGSPRTSRSAIRRTPPPCGCRTAGR
jgi:hypothetical protein